MVRLMAKLVAAAFFLLAAGNFLAGLLPDPNAVDGFTLPINFIWTVLIAAPGFGLWAWSTTPRKSDPK